MAERQAASARIAMKLDALLGNLEDAIASARKEPRCHVSALSGARICLNSPPTRLNRDVQHPACITFSVPSSHHGVVQEY